MQMAFLESSSSGEEKEKMDFPPGFRFDPLLSELILYVNLKNYDLPLPYEIPEADLYDCHPKDLTGTVATGFYPFFGLSSVYLLVGTWGFCFQCLFLPLFWVATSTFLVQVMNVFYFCPPNSINRPGNP